MPLDNDTVEDKPKRSQRYEYGGGGASATRYKGSGTVYTNLPTRGDLDKHAITALRDLFNLILEDWDNDDKEV